MHKAIRLRHNETRQDSIAHPLGASDRTASWRSSINRCTARYIHCHSDHFTFPEARFGAVIIPRLGVSSTGSSLIGSGLWWSRSAALPYWRTRVGRGRARAGRKTAHTNGQAGPTGGPRHEVGLGARASGSGRDAHGPPTLTSPGDTPRSCQSRQACLVNLSCMSTDCCRRAAKMNKLSLLFNKPKPASAPGSTHVLTTAVSVVSTGWTGRTATAR